MFANTNSGTTPGTFSMMGLVSSRPVQASLRLARKPVHALLHLPPTRLLITLSVILLMSSWGVAAYFAFRSHNTVIDSSRAVVTALIVEEQAQRVLAVLDRAEGAGRAYLLTQRREYLAPYHAAADKVGLELDRLAAGDAGQPGIAGEVDTLRTLIRERLELIARQIELVAPGRSGSDNSAFVVAVNQRGIELMDAIHAGVWRIIEAEQTRLAGRQEELSVRARFGRAWLALFFGVNAVFAIAAFVLAIRMNRLHRFAKVCAWSRTIEYEGEWLSFEKYLERRFKIRTSHGISPSEATKLMEQSPGEFSPKQDAS